MKIINKIIKNKDNKKSQMEVFGLAVIIVIISIGFFLVVSYRISAPKEDIKKDYTYDELGQNFLNSIINVNVQECSLSRYTVADLVKLCSKRENIDNKCNGATACTALYNTLKWIFDNSLGNGAGARNDGFIFRTENLNAPIGPGFPTGGELRLNNPNKVCVADTNKGRSGMIPISLFPQPGNVYLYLDICKT